jgi:hypothetical protein
MSTLKTPEQAYKSTIWQNYEVDPLDLIGRTVRLTVVKRGYHVVIGSTSDRRVKAEMTYHFGVVESISDPRGETILDEPDDNWAEEALDAVWDGTYPAVRVDFRGGLSVTFDPERDAASFEWVEASE